MNNTERGGGFTPENEPRPMSFGEFIDSLKNPDSKYAHCRDKNKAYTEYIKMFYHDLSDKHDQERDLYTNYVNDFLKRKHEGDPTAPNELLSFDAFISNQ